MKMTARYASTCGCPRRSTRCAGEMAPSGAGEFGNRVVNLGFAGASESRCRRGQVRAGIGPRDVA
jgi:hypothetical protein